MTVSRALRQLPSVSEKTRSRIFEAAARLGYLPMLSAGRKAELHEELQNLPVQIIVRESNGRLPRFQSELMLELIRLLAAKGFESIVRVSDGTYKEFLQMLSHAGKAQVAATILVGSFQEKELRALLRAIPGAILLDDPGSSVPECVYSIFSFDNFRAAMLAVKHLVDQGRKKILLVTGPREHFFSEEIKKGYKEALTDAGLSFDPSMVLYTDFTVRSATEKVTEFMDAGGQFDAVFTNDEMAGGVYGAVMKRGIRIPDQVAVCGCDGLPVGEQLYPGLTTVVLDYKQLAEKVIENSIARKEDSVVPMHMRLLPTLLLRESS